MDEELCHYTFRLPCLPDSLPGAHVDTPSGQVSWRDNDLELSRFKGKSEGSAVVVDLHDYAATKYSQITATMYAQAKGGHLHFSK